MCFYLCRVTSRWKGHAQRKATESLPKVYLDDEEKAPELGPLAGGGARLQALIGALDGHEALAAGRIFVRVVFARQPPVRPLQHLLVQCLVQRSSDNYPSAHLSMVQPHLFPHSHEGFRMIHLICLNSGIRHTWSL